MNTSAYRSKSTTIALGHGRNFKRWPGRPASTPAGRSMTTPRRSHEPRRRYLGPVPAPVWAAREEAAGRDCAVRCIPDMRNWRAAWVEQAAGALCRLARQAVNEGQVVLMRVSNLY